jgi:cell division protein FtsQ
MRGALVLRLTAWGIALTLVALPLVGLLNGWFAADRWPVRQLEIEAEFGHVSTEQIRTAAATQFDVGFFALDLAALQQRVAELPWVQKVEARKRWPDTVVVRVYEAQPYAHWGEQRLIGRDGRLFSVPGAEGLQGLPQLSGPDERLPDVLAFYSDAQKLFRGTALAVTHVDLSHRGSWTLGFDSGAKIVVGNTEDAQGRLKRFIGAYPRLAAQHAGSAFELADLRYTNGFAMKWPPAAPVTPAHPTAPVAPPPAPPAGDA